MVTVYREMNASYMKINRCLARRMVVSVAAVTVMFVLSGCSITGLDFMLKLPNENEPEAQVKVKDSTGSETDRPERTAATSSPLPSPVRLSSSISGFRSSTVILYSRDVGSDGVRLSAAALPTPLVIRGRSSDGGRLEISTVEGPRWIAASDAILDGSVAGPSN